MNRAGSLEMLSIGYDITDRKSNQKDLPTGSASWISKFLEGTDIREEVFEEVYTLLPRTFPGGKGREADRDHLHDWECSRSDWRDQPS